MTRLKCVDGCPLEDVLVRILHELGQVVGRLGVIEAEQKRQGAEWAKTGEDLRLVRRELSEQHEHIVGLIEATPANGTRA